MKQKKTPVRAALLALVLLTVAALAVLNLTRQSAPEQPDASAVPERLSAMAEESARAVSEPERDPADTAEPEGADASGSTGQAAGSAGASISDLAPEGDPYPGLYTRYEEKTDDNTQKIVYLTFDDGPSENTDRILEILKQYDVKAAFFVSGQYGTTEERARRMRDILDQGHTLGLHTYSHSYEKIYASMDAYLADLNKINEEVVAATGYHASLIRFPGGSRNQHNEHICEELTAEVTRRGYTYHDWAVSCGDAEGKNLSAAQEMRETADACEKRAKSVVLFHDTPSQNATVEALGGLIEELRNQGYEFRALDNSIRPFQFVKQE